MSFGVKRVLCPEHYLVHFRVIFCFFTLNVLLLLFESVRIIVYDYTKGEYCKIDPLSILLVAASKDLFK